MIELFAVFFLHNILLLYLWGKSRIINRRIGKKNFLFLFVLFFALSILGLQSGDYNYYKELVQEINSGMSSAQDVRDALLYLHMEPLYNYLAFLVNGNYLLWRAVVFGVSIVFLFLFARKIELDYWPFLFLFALINFRGFIVGRMYWGDLKR